MKRKLGLFLSILFLTGTNAWAITKTPADLITTTTGSFSHCLGSQDTDVQHSLNDVDRCIGNKQNTITTGTTAQYLRGDLTLATFPTNVSTFNNDSGYATASAVASTYVPKTTTVNGQALSSNVVVTTISGNAGTATALATTPTQCNAGYFPRGIDTAGNVQNCTQASTGSVTAVTASSPLISSGGTTPNMSIQQGSGTQPGYISAADWLTFNGKQGAITTGTTAQYLRGDLTLATFPTNLNQFTNGPGYITGNQTITISGDASGSGTTAITLTLPTVNSSPGSYTNANITVDGKGRVTAASTGSGVGAVSSVSNSDGTLIISPTSGAVVAALNAMDNSIQTLNWPNKSMVTKSSYVGTIIGGIGQAIKATMQMFNSARSYYVNWTTDDLLSASYQISVPPTAPATGQTMVASDNSGHFGWANDGTTFTDGTHTVTGAKQLTVTGATVGGTSPNATLTVTGGGGSGTVANGTIGQEAVYTGTNTVGSGIITDDGTKTTITGSNSTGTAAQLGGGVSIGAGYVNTTPPANGLLVQGVADLHGGINWSDFQVPNAGINWSDLYLHTNLGRNINWSDLITNNIGTNWTDIPSLKGNNVFGGNGTFGGKVGIGTTSPTGKLNVLSATENLRLSYDATHYASFTENSAGDLTIGGTTGVVNATTFVGALTGNASTATNISTNGTANQVWGMNAGASAQGWQTPAGGGITGSGTTGQVATFSGSTALTSVASNTVGGMSCVGACPITFTNVSSFSITGLNPGKNYFLFLNIVQNGAGGTLSGTFNSDTNSRYYADTIDVSNGSLAGYHGSYAYFPLLAHSMGNGAYETCQIYFWTVPGDNTQTTVNSTCGQESTNGNADVVTTLWNHSATLSSVQIFTTSGTFSGTAGLYQLS
jgi:hypothetical protein